MRTSVSEEPLFLQNVRTGQPPPTLTADVFYGHPLIIVNVILFFIRTQQAKSDTGQSQQLIIEEQWDLS